MSVDPITQSYLDTRSGPTLEETLADFVALKEGFPKTAAAQTKEAGLGSRIADLAGIGRLFGNTERLVGSVGAQHALLPSGQRITQALAGAPLTAARGMHNIPTDLAELRRAVEGMGGRVRLDPRSGDVFVSRLGSAPEGGYFRRSIFKPTASMNTGSGTQRMLDIAPDKIKGQYWAGGQLRGTPPAPTPAQAAAQAAARRAAPGTAAADIESMAEIAKRRGKQLAETMKKHPLTTAGAAAGGGVVGGHMLFGGDGKQRRAGSPNVVFLGN